MLEAFLTGRSYTFANGRAQLGDNKTGTGDPIAMSNLILEQAGQHFGLSLTAGRECSGRPCNNIPGNDNTVNLDWAAVSANVALGLMVTITKDKDMADLIKDAPGLQRVASFITLVEMAQLGVDVSQGSDARKAVVDAVFTIVSSMGPYGFAVGGTYFIIDTAFEGTVETILDDIAPRDNPTDGQVHR
jgi:hypothetical protein